MENLLQEVIELKLEHEQKLHDLLCWFTERNLEEKHLDVQLFKHRLVWHQTIIIKLDTIIENNTPI